LQDFSQREALAEAQAELDCAETSMAGANAALVAARKKQTDVAAAVKPAVAAAKDAAPAGDAAPAPNQPAPEGDAAAKQAAEANAATLAAAMADAESAAAVVEQEMLSASASLVAARARITADNAAFASPPAGNAPTLAREASRAQRVADVEQTKRNVLRLERELAQARAGTDDAAKKKVAATEPKLAEARKARETAQAALGQAGETYRRFGEVYPSASTGRRAALARWIASKNNPLAARVAINHIWLRHFGSPLVTTVFDFGLNGKRPTHPELLDWLAVELMDLDWKMKPIHRLIVTSSAYRMQSASADESNRARDPENQYLWHMNPRRMEAEVVRDSTLSVAGSLDPTMFGPDIDHQQGLTVPRRSIYFRSSKEKKVTFLELFDSANVTDCYRRAETVVPQQALAMVNSSLTLVQSRRLATSLTAELGTQPNAEGLSAFVATAFERILCRPPTSAEQAECLGFLDSQARRLADPSTLAAFSSGGENSVKPAADPAQRARENLVHVLLNHNDFLTVH
jgi:hypothetical protein